LKLFARTHWRQIARAIRLNRPWDPEQLADVHAAFTALGQHPLCTDSELVLHYDILNWLGAPGEAVRVLDEALERFPESWDLHDRLRTRIFKERGKDGLEAVYEELLRREDASTNLEWFAGYASLVAAEFYRRSGHPEQALAAYERGIAHYERSIETQPESRFSADHYVALAIAGRARIAYEAGDDRQALEAILASFDRAPEAAATPDGLGLSPVSTAQMLLARLSEKRQTDAALRLKGALDGLAPELLELPAFERGGPPR
jgi:tetratricopeptide (TPR) repeat protein